MTQRLPRRAPLAAPPTSRQTRAPQQRAAAKVPNPRRLVRTRRAAGKPRDLFDVFPDLPRPPRAIPRRR